MTDFSIKGSGVQNMARHAFGAGVVSKTLDYMNNSSSMSSGILTPVDKTTFGAQVVTRTLDFMNAKPFGGSSNNDYEFQKDVLSAATAGKGAIFSKNA